MKAVILTGYSSGLGKALHEALLELDDGCKLIFIGRGANRSLNKYRYYCSLDFSNIMYEDFGFLDALLVEVDEVTFINNAAIIDPISCLKEINTNMMINSMNINYFAPAFLLSKLMKLCEKVKVLNISSGAATKPIPYWGAYCSSKSAIKSFFDVASIEGVEIVHIDPGVIDTGMQEKIRGKSAVYPELEGFNKMYEGGKLRKPEDVAIEVCQLL